MDDKQIRGRNKIESHGDEQEARGAAAASLSRRAFLGRLGRATALTMGASVAGLPRLPEARAAQSKPLLTRSNTANQRRNQAYKIRHEAALFHLKVSPPTHRNNGDEALYPKKIASYSKGLPHNLLGEVDPFSYRAMIHALTTGAPSDFERIPMGCVDAARQRRLVNPQAGLAFELEGADAHELTIPPAPAFASAEQAAEIVENYWMALLRDVPFLEYDVDSLAQAAAADLNALADFRGPKIGAHVVPPTLFRGLTPGDRNGPYLSQFFWLPAPYGANFIQQKLQTTVTGLDYLIII